MQQETGQKALIAFAVAVTPVVFFGIYEAFRVVDDLRSGQSEIPINTGAQYMLLGSIMWVALAVQTVGLKGNIQFVDKWAGKIILWWFIGCLVLAVTVPFSLRAMMESEGYHACKDPDSPPRTGVRGRRYIYSQEPCQ